jgi:hypothetical protein
MNIDESDETTKKDKVDCWSRWLEYYSNGQPSERLRFAKERLRVLIKGYKNGK